MPSLSMMHDCDLERMATSESLAILSARTKGANLVRLTLARVFGRSDMATAEQWHIVPHVTERDTIGLVNVSDGTAWDSLVAVDDSVRTLGLDAVHTPDGNHPSLSGDVRFDGELVQARGETPDHPITAPPGWFRIGLPTWRGYAGDHYVPVELYRPKNWIRPNLRAVGLMTCYGHPGAPRASLGSGSDHCINGVPPWIEPIFSGRPRIGHLPMPDDVRKRVSEASTKYLRSLISHVARGMTWLPELEKQLDTAPPWQAMQSFCDLERKSPFLLHRPSSEDLFEGYRLNWAGSLEGRGVIGDSTIDVLVAALHRAIDDRIASAAQPLLDIWDSMSRKNGGNPFVYKEKWLTPLVASFAEKLLHGAPNGHDLIRSVCDVIYADGPIYCDIPALDSNVR